MLFPFYVFTDYYPGARAATGMECLQSLWSTWPSTTGNRVVLRRGSEEGEAELQVHKEAYTAVSAMGKCKCTLGYFMMSAGFSS